MNQKKITALTAISFAAALTLAACGGGGGSSNSGSNNSASNSGSSSSGTTPLPSSPTTGNLTTPQYSANSAQQAIFNMINRQRQQCGFPALTENTLLDQAGQAHADYIGKNGGTLTDYEVATNPGFTGVTYTDRAAHFGYPTNTTYASGEGAGYYTNTTLSEADYGQEITNQWLGGVYHAAVLAWPITQLGVGWNETTYNGFPEIHGVIEIANLQPMVGNLPLTFPCQGSTNIPYAETGETPTPLNTSGAFGTPITVSGNATDTVVLQSATVTDGQDHTITLELLNSSNDPNKLIPQFSAVAYAAAPLNPSTVYNVSLTGTYNGTPFSRAFSFTTGTQTG